MRTFYVFAAICIVGVYSVPVDNKPDVSPYMEECANKLNIDLPKLDKLVADTNKPTDDLYCLIDCAIEQGNKEKGITETHYEYWMRIIKEVDEKHGVKNQSYTRQQLESTLIECNSKGLSGCGFLKCIGESPISDFAIHYG